MLGTLSTNADANIYTTSYNVGIDGAGNAYGYENNHAPGVAYPASVPVRWDAAGTAVKLDVFPSVPSDRNPSTIAAVNAGGTAIGSSRLKAARWDVGGTAITRLNAPQSLTDPYAGALNDAGTIIGYGIKSNVSEGERALRWEAGATVATELGTLGLNTNGSTTSRAYGLSSTGAAAGFAKKYANSSDRGTRAVKWRADQAAAVELGHLGLSAAGVTNSEAWGINAKNMSVGFAQRYTTYGIDLGRRAVLWDEAGIAIDLNRYLEPDSNWTLTDCRFISDTGFISGFGNYSVSGPGAAVQQRFFVMLVPEAGTYGRGDANFDTLINFDDLLLLAQHYSQANPTQDVNVADLNLDGLTNFDDLLALAQNYGTGPTLTADVSPDFAADWALAQSLVPEPATLVALALPLAVARRRRR